MAILYRSKDFIHWTRAQHPFHSANGTGMWECPDFYPVSMKSKSGIDTSEYGNGLKYVLKNSLDVIRYEYYTVGSYRRDLDWYIPDGTMLDDGRGLRYDYDNFYASKTFFDAGKKRRILWGWTNESDSRRDDASKGWAGLQAIPRAVWLDSNGRQLIQWPVEELEGLRGKSVSVKNKTIKSGGFLEIPGIMTTQADVEVIFQLSSLSKAEHFDPKWTDLQKLCEHKGADVKGGVGPFGLLTLASAMREEHTAVYFTVFKAPNKYVALLCHDPSRSTIRPGLYKPTFGGWVDADIQRNGKISMRNLIDNYGTLSANNGKYPSPKVGKRRLLAFVQDAYEPVHANWTTERCVVCQWVEDWDYSKIIICNRVALYIQRLQRIRTPYSWSYYGFSLMTQPNSILLISSIWPQQWQNQAQPVRTFSTVKRFL